MAIFRGTGSASATADQTTIDTVTQAVVDAEAAQAAAETAQGLAETAKTDAENLYGDLTAVEAAKDTAVASASTATTQAGIATTKASEAATSASDANDSYVLTRGAFLDFETKYLGVLTSDPLTDNQGNPLEEGALYFNSTDDVMRTYDGSEWFTAFASLGGALVGTNNLSDVSNAATSLVNLGLNATADEINVLDVSAQTPTDGQVLTYDTTNGLNWETPSFTEVNDLTASVTWANVPDANITESSVTQHQAALSITESQISDFGSYEPADATILKDADIGVTVQAYDATIVVDADIANMLETTDIGVTVQGYDADTAKTDTAQTFTASQRGTVTTDNDLSFDMNATNFFKCTPAANGTLTFTNITAGQSGNIWLDNSGGYTISAASSTYIASADLTTISTAGVYWISYYSDGTNVMVSATPAVTSAGA